MGAARDRDGPHARVRDDQKLAVWDRAAATVADPALGLHVGASAPLGRWGLAEQVVLHAPTFGAGLEAAVRFASLMADGERLHLDRVGGRATFTMGADSAPPDPAPAGWRHYLESEAAYAVRLVRLAVSPAFVPDEVWLPHARPAGMPSEPYERALGPGVRFGQPALTVVFDAGWLAAPVVGAVAALRVPLEVEAARALARIEADRTVADRVEGFVRLDPAAVTLDDAAERLGMAARTLQRRLTEEGTTFGAVLDGVRREYAGAYLRDPSLPLGEVSYRLGFSEPSALYRAVKRWLGVTAAEYRRAVQAGYQS